MSKYDLSITDQLSRVADGLEKVPVYVANLCARAVAEIQKPKLTDLEFRMLLDLWMVSDPWPLSPGANDTLEGLLTMETSLRGFESIVEAFHAMHVPEEATA